MSSFCFLSILVLNVYPGFWYLTRDVACIRSINVYRRYFINVCTQHWRWYGEKKAVTLSPPPASYFAAIFTQKITRSVAWAIVCPSGNCGPKRSYMSCDCSILIAMGPYPRPDCGKAQIPGGWAVQQVPILLRILKHSKIPVLYPKWNPQINYS